MISWEESAAIVKPGLRCLAGIVDEPKVSNRRTQDERVDAALGGPCRYAQMPGATQQSPLTGIVSTHANAAALWVDFLFSRAGQQVYASQNRLVARKDMKWNFKGKELRSFHMISPEKWGPRYNELVKMFDEIFRRGRQ